MSTSHGRHIRSRQSLSSQQAGRNIRYEVRNWHAQEWTLLSTCQLQTSTERNCEPMPVLVGLWVSCYLNPTPITREGRGGLSVSQACMQEYNEKGLPSAVVNVPCHYIVRICCNFAPFPTPVVYTALSSTTHTSPWGALTYSPFWIQPTPLDDYF